MTRIIGIDPGLAIVGYSIIEFENDTSENLKLIGSGSIQTEKTNTDSKRLFEIYKDLNEIIKKYSPEIASIEKLFFFKNQKTVMQVSQARGVILSVLEKYNLQIFEYTPIEIKQATTGFGRASKKEVETFVKMNFPYMNVKLDDTIDSIAISICHIRNLKYSKIIG